MLVNINKLLLFFLILLQWNLVQAQEAQETWTLRQCIDTALIHNKNLQMGRNQIEMSQSKTLEAKANLKPKITVNADYKYFIDMPTQLMPKNAINPQMPKGEFNEIKFGVPHNINANIQMVLPLINPQIKGAIHNSKIAQELTDLQYRKSEEEVLFDITSLYYNAQIVKSQLDFIESNLVNTNKLLNNIQLLKSQLMATGVDVNKIQLQKDQLTTKKEKVHNNLNQILNALKLNMGIDLDTELMVNTDIIFKEILDETPQNTLDIQLLQTQNKLLQSELDLLNKIRKLPTLNLIASYGSSGFGYDQSPNEFLKFYMVSFAGLQLSYPLFDGSISKIKMEQKTLEIRNNELQTQLIDDKIKMEIENMSQEKRLAQKSVLDTENQIELAQKIYEQTLLQQKHGVASLTEILLADNALREAQQDYLNGIIDYLKADLELKNISGNIHSIKN